MDNTYVFAFLSAVLKRIGVLLGKDRGGDIFIQVSKEVWDYFIRQKGKLLPVHPDDYDLN